MAKPVKRPYESAKRAAQAEATRASIIDAALHLFATDGYVATTIQAIADEAGVAVQTVYAVFGNKREVLRQVLETAVSGDAAAPLASQAEVQAIADEKHPRRRAELNAAMSTRISQRIAPVVKVLREAASADPEFAATAAAITEQRRADMAAIIDQLCGAAGPAMDVEEAMGTLYVIYSPDTYTALVGDFGWSLERYEKWMADMLYRTVMAQPRR